MLIAAHINSLAVGPAGVGGYIRSEHFRCIDLSFQLEEMRAKQQSAQSYNGQLKLEIATLRDPRRIDLLARHQLGLTQPIPSQVREYTSLDEAQVAAVRYVRPNRAP